MKNQSFTDLIIDGLKNAAAELEELRLQLALGKLEARELFEDVKRSFHGRIQSAKSRLDEFRQREDVLQVINAIEHLQVQLSLGMAETAELFEEQKEKIQKGLSELESRIKNNQEAKDAYAELRLEAEKFRLKLQLLAMHYKLGRIKTEYEFEKRKDSFMEDLEKLREKLKGKEEKVRDRFTHFQDEMGEAFRHIKKAFEQP